MDQTISYARLIRLPNVLPLLGATCLTRLADRMFGIVIVFHALAAFGSPRLAVFCRSRRSCRAAVSPSPALCWIAPAPARHRHRPRRQRDGGPDLAAAVFLGFANRRCCYCWPRSTP